MILCGMFAGNPVTSIMTRALLGLLGGFVLGSLAGWIGLYIVRENARPAFGDDADAMSPEAGMSATRTAERASVAMSAGGSMPTVR